MYNLCSPLLFHEKLLIKKLQTSAFVLVKGIVFNRSKGSMIKFQESYNIKCFKEIKPLKSSQKAEAYLEPKQVSLMELFCE